MSTLLTSGCRVDITLCTMDRCMTESPNQLANVKIIIIDKDLDIRAMMEMLLGDHFHVETVGSAEAGLDLLESKGPFDIAIASFTLSGMNGVEFLRRVGEINPEAVRILLTGGCADMRDLELAISKGYISRIVLKPFCMITLLEQLRLDMSVIEQKCHVQPLTYNKEEQKCLLT